MGRFAQIGLLLAAFAAVVSGCGILDRDGEVEVRVRNGSGVVLDEATLFLPNGPLVHFDLDPGEESLYVEVSKAYRIASAEVVVGQDTARIQVIDYVGESELKPGRYTYIFQLLEGVPLGMALDFKKES